MECMSFLFMMQVLLQGRLVVAMCIYVAMNALAFPSTHITTTQAVVTTVLIGSPPVYLCSYECSGIPIYPHEQGLIVRWVLLTSPYVYLCIYECSGIPIYPHKQVAVVRCMRPFNGACESVKAGAQRTASPCVCLFVMLLCYTFVIRDSQHLASSHSHPMASFGLQDRHAFRHHVTMLRSGTLMRPLLEMKGSGESSLAG